MSKYTLFGKPVMFSPAAERFFRIRTAAFAASDVAFDRFQEWYVEKRDIKSVLDGYEIFSQKFIEETLADYLFKELTSCEIYDISKAAFIASCTETSARAEALDIVEEKYFSILSKQEGEEAYRRARKASRGRWQGGGFGLSGAIKGAVQAGAMNAVSGLGHSLANAVGNAGSAISAVASKSELYNSLHTKNLLADGIRGDLISFSMRAIILIENENPACICLDYDEKKAEALFENAKRLPQKRTGLLLQAFEQDPTNKELLSYLFIQYPEERKEVYRAAEHFLVDLSAQAEAVLEKEYTEAAQKSEDLAKEARERILAFMKEYGIKESKTLDRLETDCLKRLCSGFEIADEAACKSLLSAVEGYEADAKNKEPFVTKLDQRIDKLEVESLQALCKGYESADEASCNALVEAVNKSGKRESNKKILLDKLQTRIEEIWSAEDGEIFDNLYFKTDITNAEARNEAIQYVKEKGRTSSSEKYIKALEGCTDKNIGYAREYRAGKKSKIYNTVALSGTVAWLINLIWITAGTLPAVLVLAAALICLHKTALLRNAWKLLTIDGTVLHPVITKDIPERAKGVPFVVYCIPVTAVLVGFFFAFRALVSLI